MQEIQVRRGGLADAASIAEVHRLSRASYYGLAPDPVGSRDQMWSELVAQAGRSTHVAESSDGILGFVSTVRRNDPAHALELTSLYVLPSHFGSGIGAALYQEFDHQLSPGQLGLLEAWAGNYRAIEFYLRRGWHATSHTRPGPRDLAYVTYEL